MVWRCSRRRADDSEEGLASSTSAVSEEEEAEEETRRVEERRRVTTARARWAQEQWARITKKIWRIFFIRRLWSFLGKYLQNYTGLRKTPRLYRYG